MRGAAGFNAAPYLHPAVLLKFNEKRFVVLWNLHTEPSELSSLIRALYGSITQPSDSVNSFQLFITARFHHLTHRIEYNASVAVRSRSIDFRIIGCEFSQKANSDFISLFDFLPWKVLRFGVYSKADSVKMNPDVRNKAKNASPEVALS